MTDRFASCFDPFVLPFLMGMVFVLLYCIIGVIRIIGQLSSLERKNLIMSLVNPVDILKNIRDIFLDCLLHVRLWKRNRLLGYMHSSIAFGWFLLIIVGHLEVLFLLPNRSFYLYYPIFFKYFAVETTQNPFHTFLFLLMDVILIYILSGIILAIYKRMHSRLFGMRRTPQHSLINRIGMYALWTIFPLRLIAEVLISHVSVEASIPFWWAYSISLSVFLMLLPFSRYMHIPAEMFLIPLRNAGIRMSSARKGFASVQILSCPSCGVCIDACPMTADKSNLIDTTVYLNRQLRSGNEARIREISDKCLLCGKCKEVCQVGLDGAQLRILARGEREYNVTLNSSAIHTEELIPHGSKVLYYSGCMSKLVPSIGKSVVSILRNAGIDFIWVDRDNGVCCGRPLLMAGRQKEAMELVRKNEVLFKASGADTMVVSCPICYRMFTEQYDLKPMKVVHYIHFMEDLVSSNAISVERSDICYVYHDPCELGRGCGIFNEPRRLLGRIANVAEADKNQLESVCCGGSLGSISLSFPKREKLTKAALKNLYTSNADAIATACPLCLATFSRYADRPVWDIAEIVDSLMVKKIQIDHAEIRENKIPSC